MTHQPSHGANATPIKLSERDMETLGELDTANRNLTEVGHRGGWAKPLDCGGSNGSHHGPTLAKLFRAGLADRKGYTPGIRPVWRYKINAAGIKASNKYIAQRRRRHSEKSSTP